MDQPTATITAQAINVAALIFIAWINKTTWSTAKNGAQSGKISLRARVLMWCSCFVAIAVPGWALWWMASSPGAVDRQFIILSMLLGCSLLVGSLTVVWLFFIGPLVRIDFVRRMSGLTISFAKYGRDNSIADVTERLRSEIRQGRLRVTVSNALAISDPCPNVKKFLTVRFTANGVDGEKTIPEGQTLELP